MPITAREAMKRLAGTITTNIEQAASASARPLNEVADHLGEASKVSGMADRDGYDRITASIRGHDEYGELAVFSPDDVIYHALRDRRGLRGIAFPTKDADEFHRIPWIKRAGEKFDREYHHFWPVTTLSTRKSDYEFDPTPQPIPGADGAEAKRAIIVQSHANPDGFAVKVRTHGPPDLRSGSPPLGSESMLPSGRKNRIIPSTFPPRLVYPTRNIFLGGAEYGRLLAAKKSELEDAAEAPDSPIRFVSCSAGAPEGDAAESAVASMRENGINREVNAGTDTMILAEGADGSSVIGIVGRGDPHGNISPAWRTFPASPLGDTS
ncbi:hypothetical protein [Nocardia grenadensis]|uniref:hypothetical protein n=1 Tax=Nocardia grenadensis TaxID=931537 RepID=UPI003D75F70D